MVFEIASISSSAKKIIEMAGLGAVFSLPAVSSPDAETEDGLRKVLTMFRWTKLLLLMVAWRWTCLMIIAMRLKLNLPDTDADPNLDFSDDTPKEDDFTMDFDEETNELISRKWLTIKKNQVRIHKEEMILAIQSQMILNLNQVLLSNLEDL